ncbi:MAG: hypothetical protein ACTSWR_11745 [Candidatus Helarchaeota archaeon]
MNLFKNVIELLSIMYYNNEFTFTIKKLRKKLKINQGENVHYEIYKIVKWLVNNNYIKIVNKNSKYPFQYEITKDLLNKKQELELFYK